MNINPLNLWSQKLPIFLTWAIIGFFTFACPCQTLIKCHSQIVWPSYFAQGILLYYFSK
jgi:hypothetical protein